MEQTGVKLISHVDCPGGGQVWVDGTHMYVGHMRHPSGTSIYNVSDPKSPVLVCRISMEDGWHSHKVRVANDIMLVNHEKIDEAAPGRGGLAVYDVSNPRAPQFLTKWETDGRGVHRFDFDGRYAYISPTAEGFSGNICMILDLKDPANPVEVSRWWIPGQWTGGGEEYPWAGGPAPRCHHPLRYGDRLYVSYWHHGFFILDISDITKPRELSRFNTSPSFPHPIHTCMPLPFDFNGRKAMIVANEDVARLRPSAPAFTWLFDITMETQPIPISTFRVEGQDEHINDGKMIGCHQPSERIDGPVVPFAWFSKGMRLVDFSDPWHPVEVGNFLPDPAPGAEMASSNDVTIDDRGLIYIVDRVNGIHIVERV